MAKEKTPDEIEASLRKSAERFGADLLAAREAGFNVLWPAGPEGLAAIEISGTAATQEQPVDLQPTPETKGAPVAAGASTTSSAAKA